MKNKITIFLLSLFLFSCAEYKDSKKLEDVSFKENNKNKYDIVETKKGKKIIDVIESLNDKNYKISELLNNLYLDYEFNEIHLTYDKGFSTRNFIINHVENKKALEFILLSDNKSFSKIPNQEIVKEKYSDFVYQIPLIDKSLKELVKLRLQELKEN